MEKTPTHPASRHTLRSDLLMLGAALLLLVAWEFTGLDLPLTRLYGDVHGFAWRDHWLTGRLLHDGTRAAAWALFGVLLLGLWWPLPAIRCLRRSERIWWLGTMLVCVALIPVLKQASATSCPWSLAQFGGGLAPYVPHWMLGVRDGGPGRCFPSGHASTAFAFLAGWFALRERAPQPARLWLIVTVAVGLALSWVQMMRGAHFMSHSLWTAWICWAVTALSFHASRSWLARR